MREVPSLPFAAVRCESCLSWRASWARVVDTNLPPPRDFSPEGSSKLSAEYTVMPYTSVMLKSKPAT